MPRRFDAVSVSPRKTTDSTAICMSIMFWRIEISKAYTLWSAWFHRKNAAAVFTTPSQSTMPQPTGLSGVKPSTAQAEPAMKTVPPAMANADNPRGPISPGLRKTRPATR